MKKKPNWFEIFKERIWSWVINGWWATQWQLICFSARQSGQWHRPQFRRWRWKWCQRVSLTHPVEDRGPALHGDALEDGEHGKDDVVEAGDPLVWTLPVLQADWLVGPGKEEQDDHLVEERNNRSWPPPLYTAILISTGVYPQHLMLKLGLAKHSFSML